MAVVADQTRDVVSEAAKKTTFEVNTTFFDRFQLSLFEKRFFLGTVVQNIMHIVHGTIM
jgi:hypothetical protein